MFSQIPSSYSTQNFLFQLGFDLSDDTGIEIRYERVDDSDHEYPGQIFDVNFMGTDALNLSYFSHDFSLAIFQVKPKKSGIC